MVLQDKVAIVTGGAQGIGLAIARALGREGCRVVVVGRATEKLVAAVSTLAAAGATAGMVQADVGEAESDRTIVEQTTSQFGPPDILVNNAGILHSEPVESVTQQSWDEVMRINLRGAFFLALRCIDSMKRKGEGYVVNVSSTVAFGVPGNLATYGISKHGIVGMSQTLWDSVRGSGVKVSTIYPGITDTQMVRDINDGDPSLWMKPEDIAECVLFLLRLGPRIIVKEIVPWAVGYDRI